MTAPVDSASVTSDSVMAPTPELTMATLHLVGRQHCSDWVSASSEPRTSVFSTILTEDFLLAHVGKQVFQLHALLTIHLGLAFLVGTEVSHFTGLALVIHHQEFVAGIRCFRQPRISTGMDGPADLMGLPFSSPMARTRP
jgi:hypothetical protein